MEDSYDKQKTAEESQLEKTKLARMHRNIYYHWENHRGRYHIPETLDENFVLVWWLRSLFQGNDVPKYYFEYLSNYGSIRLNMWLVNKEKKSIVVSEDMYTLGNDGKTRGKGKQGLQSIHRILQSISDSTGYTVYDVATPNKGSTSLLTEQEGYRLFTTEDELMLYQNMDQSDIPRWNVLIETAKPSPSKIKQYAPSKVSLELSPREHKEIDTIVDVALLKRIGMQK